MKATLQPGIEHTFTFDITDSKTVPALYPESEEFQLMPEVFATGFMVGFLEWACIQAVNPHIDWPGEQTVGTYIIDKKKFSEKVKQKYKLNTAV